MAVDRSRWLADIDSVKEVIDEKPKPVTRKKKSFAVTDDDIRAMQEAAVKRGESLTIRLLPENQAYLTKYYATTRHARGHLINVCIAFAAKHDALRHVQVKKPAIVYKAEDIVDAYEAGVHIVQKGFQGKHSLGDADLTVYYDKLADQEAEEELAALRRENDE